MSATSVRPHYALHLSDERSTCLVNAYDVEAGIGVIAGNTVIHA